jgi:geranylgeranyl pyrophosphate synthase
MLIKVFEAAVDGPLDPATKNRLVERFADRAFQITRGQALEFELNTQQDFTDEDIVEVLRSKTGALVALACEAGAIVGGASRIELLAATRFGESAGVGFQIVDDLLNVVGEVKKYGKEIGGDIREGKRTIMAAHLIKSAPPEDRNRFMSFLGKLTITQQEISEAIDMYRQYGSMEHAKRTANRHIEDALPALKKLPKSESRDTLGALAEFLIRRDF